MLTIGRKGGEWVFQVILFYLIKCTLYPQRVLFACMAAAGNVCVLMEINS
jgi:hypothetical protein